MIFVRLATASLLVLSLFTPTTPAEAQSVSSAFCQKSYSRTTAHKVFRTVYRNPTRVSRHERRTIRRVIRCQGSARSRANVRRHHARYKRHHRVAPPGNRGIAYVILWRRGQLAQFGCLDALWGRESGWQHRRYNMAGSGAYGIPQSLPGSKMASAGADWETNPATQIRWGLGYIAGRYGTPCGADAFQRANNWY